MSAAIPDAGYGGAGTWPYGGPPGQVPGAAGAGPWGESAGSGRPGRRGGRCGRWIVPVVAAAVVAALVGAGVAVTRFGNPSPGGLSKGVAVGGKVTGAPGLAAPAVGSGTAAATPEAAVQAILDRRAAALRTGDLAGWLAEVDSSQPVLMAHQRMLFTNLRQLPLSLFRYTVDRGAETATSDVPAAVASTLSGFRMLYSPWRSLEYQFTGFDPAPVRDRYLPIFGLRGDKWLLAGDQTVARSDYRWIEPWDSEPILVGYGRHVLVLVSAPDRRRLPGLVSVAEQALAQVGAMWPVGIHQVVLYDTRTVAVFASYLGSSRITGDYDGLTIGLGEGSGGHATDDLRVVVNPTSAPPGSGRLPSLLRHEFTHVAKWADQSAGTPLWAAEGIAEYTAYGGHPGDQLVSAQIGRDASRGRLARALPTNQSFYASATGYYDYGLAWCAFEYIFERYGESKVRALYEVEARIAGPPDSAPARAGQALAFQTVLHLSQAQFMTALAGWIKAALRPA